MKYIVFEIQSYANGTVAFLPPVPYDTLNEAYSKFHTVLASAAVSNVAVHSCLIISSNGDLVYADRFEHPQEPEE